MEKEAISVDGKSYETNSYKLVLDENTVKQILINCLTKLMFLKKALMVFK